MVTTREPVHVVPDGEPSGITLYAEQLASAAGGRLLRGALQELDGHAKARASDEAWHVHVSDRALGSDADEAAARVEAWAATAPLTVTFHDVPQAWAGDDRKHCYLRVARAVTGWVVNSHHEVALLHALGDPGRTPGHVVHLPLVARPDGSGSLPPRDGAVTLGVLGWIYPDKGHREVVRAAGRLVARGVATDVVCLGAAVAGHDDLVAELHERALRLGVGLRVTGYLDDDALRAGMQRIDVPIAAHRHLSASGSINSWTSAGRRPLVPDGRYARELAALRAGTLELYDDRDPDGRGLDATVAAALDDPTSTTLGPDAELGPGLTEVAAAYRAWWASVLFDGPHPTKPEVPSW